MTVWAAEEPPETYSDQFLREVYVPKHSQTLDLGSSCILYAKWYLGRSDESWGNAGQIKATSDKPSVGGIVLTTEGSGHVAIILHIEGSNLLITEANYLPGQISTRSLSLDDPVIRGYFSP